MTFPVPWVYLIPFLAILKPNFPISRLKKWQIPHPEKALLDPLYGGLYIWQKLTIIFFIDCNLEANAFNVFFLVLLEPFTGCALSNGHVILIMQ